MFSALQIVSQFHCSYWAVMWRVRIWHLMTRIHSSAGQSSWNADDPPCFPVSPSHNRLCICLWSTTDRPFNSIHSTSMGCVFKYHLCMYIQQMVYSFAVLSYNYINPVMHDPVTTGVGDYVTIRFITADLEDWSWANFTFLCTIPDDRTCTRFAISILSCAGTYPCVAPPILVVPCNLQVPSSILRGMHRSSLHLVPSLAL